MEAVFAESFTTLALIRFRRLVRSPLISTLLRRSFWSDKSNDLTTSSATQDPTVLKRSLHMVGVSCFLPFGRSVVRADLKPICLSYASVRQSWIVY